MLPPPRRPQLSTNADFRKLLETPRAERLGDDSRQSKPKKAAGEQEGQQKPKRKPFRPKPEVEKKEDDGSGYRRVMTPGLDSLLLLLLPQSKEKPALQVHTSIEDHQAPTLPT